MMPGIENKNAHGYPSCEHFFLDIASATGMRHQRLVAACCINTPQGHVAQQASIL